MLNSPSDKINVMIVDDSSIIRGIISKIISSEQDMQVVAVAENGKIALNLLKREDKDKIDADIIILDIEMPEMDGLTALPEIKKISPQAKVIIASTLTQRNAEISLKALSLGAVDYIPKPTSAKDEANSSNNFNRELVEKIRAIGKIKKYEIKEQQQNVIPISSKKFITKPLPKIPVIKALAIGSSTGGPQALSDIFAILKNKISDIPIFITQHMPPTFTTFLAQKIEKTSGMKCFEPKDNEKVVPGNIYLAPGDFHMIVEKNGYDTHIRIKKDPPENFCRPAVDPMLRSLSNIYGKDIMVVMLTGMGADGLKGSKIISDLGGIIIAQDEKSSVVWGMPGAVAM